MMRMTVVAPAGLLAVYQVHPAAPVNSGCRRAWSTQLQVLAASLATERLPSVAAGDFNASQWDRPYRAILHGPAGVEDAGEGRGYGATWPSSKGWVPPLLALDHILVSRNMGVADWQVLPRVGSDRRAVMADLLTP